MFDSDAGGTGLAGALPLSDFIFREAFLVFGELANNGWFSEVT